MPIKTTEEYLREILSGAANQSRFGPQLNPEADTRTMEELKAAQGISLLDAALGQGVPEYEMRLNPEIGRMEKQYKFPSGNVDIPAPQGNAPVIADLLKSPPRYDMMGQREGYERPALEPSPSGITPSIGDMPGPQHPLPRDAQDILGEAAPELERNKRNRMILSIMEGLTRAGAEASNVPLLTELLAGKGRGPTDQTTADMLAQLRGEGKAADEAKIAQAKEYDNPMVKAARKETGIDFKNIAEVQQYYATERGKADIEQSKAAAGLAKAKAGEVEEQQRLSKEQLERIKNGDLSAAPEKLKDRIFTQKESWKQENKEYQNALFEAKRLGALLDSGDAVGARAAIVTMVKIAGDTGRLSDDDIKRFEKRMGAVGVYDKLHQIVYSNLSPEQRAEFRKVADDMSKLALQEIADSAKANVQGIIQLYPQLREDDVMKVFLGTERYAASKEAERKTNQVEMFNPEDGKKYLVDPEDVEGLKQARWEVL